jgi:thiamine pyrophosphate-dependent acetolactate synthase large subunit-like protein
MSGILSTDGVSILSRYMAAMTAAIASTAASLPNNGSRLNNPNFASIAEAAGIKGIRIEVVDGGATGAPQGAPAYRTE